ncbi:MAG TPA: hypothetical protein VFC03_12900 [Acidimicrobiales bacterium]|jgi:hypothetical protein|nr:hypothetical protein [Acidimicrobiales bacterium]
MHKVPAPLNRHVERLRAGPASDPLWCFGYWGHGDNSYAYSLTRRAGTLVLAFQGLWVRWELYNSTGDDAAELARLFQVARSLLRTTEGRSGPVQVIAGASRIRGGYYVFPSEAHSKRAHQEGGGSSRFMAGWST